MKTEDLNKVNQYNNRKVFRSKRLTLMKALFVLSCIQFQFPLFWYMHDYVQTFAQEFKMTNANNSKYNAFNLKDILMKNRKLRQTPVEKWWSGKVLGGERTKKILIRTIYLTNKIPFLNVYGDINLVGHVIKSHKALHIQKWYLICYISIWDQFKHFKTSDAAFHTRLSRWPR